MTARTSSLASILSTSLLLALAMLHHPVAAWNPCLLCGSGGVNAIKNPRLVPTGSTMTCSALATSTAVRFQVSQTTCTNTRNRWKTACCTSAGASQGTQYNAQAARCQAYRNHPTFSLASGAANPKCNICRTGEYPGRTSMVINFLYIGAASCAQYYAMGQKGQLTRNMCNPIQYFAEQPCGCGQYNPMKSCSASANQAPTTNNIAATTTYSPPVSGTGGYAQAKTPTDEAKTSIASGVGGSGGGGRRLIRKYRHLKGQTLAQQEEGVVEEMEVVEEEVELTPEEQDPQEA